MVGCIAQRWRQVQERNRVDCGKVTASVYISTQWKAYKKYKKKPKKITPKKPSEGREWHIADDTSSFSVMTISTNRNTAEAKTPHFWSPDLQRPSSLRMTQGKYTSQARVRSHDLLWRISLRTVHGRILFSQFLLFTAQNYTVKTSGYKEQWSAVGSSCLPEVSLQFQKVFFFPSGIPTKVLLDMYLTY